MLYSSASKLCRILAICTIAAQVATQAAEPEQSYNVQNRLYRIVDGKPAHLLSSEFRDIYGRYVRPHDRGLIIEMVTPKVVETGAAIETKESPTQTRIQKETVTYWESAGLAFIDNSILDDATPHRESRGLVFRVLNKAADRINIDGQDMPAFDSGVPTIANVVSSSRAVPGSNPSSVATPASSAVATPVIVVNRTPEEIAKYNALFYQGPPYPSYGGTKPLPRQSFVFTVRR